MYTAQDRISDCCFILLTSPLLTGVDKKTISLVLSISGAVEIPCRVFQGWVADRHIVSAITQYTFCVITCGLAAIVCATASGLPGELIFVQ